MRLINYNYCTQPETDVTASSSNVNYPVSNLSHEFRNKVWRSSGNFVIDSTNNKINFKESAMGSELTATLTSGTYTPTTLAAEIKSQMELVGGDTYTITFSTSSGLWTVESDGSYLSLLNNTGTNASANVFKQSLGFPNTDKTGALEYTGPTIAIHTQESVVFDMQTTEEIDSVVLLWPREDGIKLSNSATIKIQANATNNWSSPSVDQTLTIDNTYSIASHYFLSNQSYRYWRVVIEDPANANLYVELGVVILGKGVDLTSENGFKYSLLDASRVTRNDFGNEWVDEYPLTASLSFDFNLLDYDDCETLDEVFRTNGNRTPLFITMDSSGAVFNKDHFALYGKIKSGLELSHISYNLFESSLEIVEVS